jgi:uncharacterized protein YcgL (UPF0745 family)|tara:strand:+ start:200 stop:364 length:165 start_codon:yes stop_codon:yes gene_type:complete
MSATTNIKVYNEEGLLVANDIDTILEVLENNGYHTNMSEEEAKKLRIERGVDDE